MRRYFNQRGSSRRPNIPNPNVPIRPTGPTGVNIREFCEKFLFYSNAGNQIMVSQIIAAYASAAGITKQQAAAALKRECTSPIDCTRITPDICKKYLTYVANNNTVGIDDLISDRATVLGISKQQAADLLKKCCQSNTGTIDCGRIDPQICEKYIFHLQNGDQANVQQTISTVADMLGIPFPQAADLLKRCCHPDHSTNGDDDIIRPDGETTLDDDCRIHCYKCQNGTPVSNRFDPVKRSKADKSGYHYDCPRGWVIDPNPCRTLSNGNNNTLTPIRDVGNTGSSNTSSGSNNTTAIPNRGNGIRPTGTWNPLGFSGNLWLNNE